MPRIHHGDLLMMAHLQERLEILKARVPILSTRRLRLNRGADERETAVMALWNGYQKPRVNLRSAVP